MDPIGKWRDDFHMAHLLSKMENLTKDVHADKNDKKRSAPMDFMPEWGLPKEEAEVEEKVIKKKQSVNEQKNILLTIAAAQNREVERKRVKK